MITGILTTLGAISIIKSVYKYSFLLKIVYNGYVNSRDYKNEKNLKKSINK